MDPKKKRYNQSDVKDPSEKQSFLSKDEQEDNYTYSRSKYKNDSKKPDYSHKNYDRVPTDEDKKSHPKWR